MSKIELNLGRLPVPEASSKEEKEKIVNLKFPLEIGFMSAPDVLDKIKEFAEQGNVQLSYKGQSGAKNELGSSTLYDFELQGRREDVDNLVEGINNIIESLRG